LDVAYIKILNIRIGQSNQIKSKTYGQPASTSYCI